jgi:hypothetical protein
LDLFEPLLALEHGLVLFPVPLHHDVVVLDVDGFRLGTGTGTGKGGAR